ncbi:MAG: TIR domain-containing protein, partial [Clostridiales bacterium]|nr:TIR domain-containing protein [Clostridiales bacterium]
MTNTLQCPNCGSTDFIQSGQSHVCKRCGTINRFSALDDGVKLSLSAAFLDRQRGRFADARAVYETVLKTDPDCHEAWFGLFLCDYSVLFETDGDGEKNPSFYGVKKTPVWESVPLKKALKLAGGETAAFDGYKAQADKIEYARAAFQRIAAVTPPWDVFICFKKTARDGGDTQDYILAQQLYAKLSQKYRVFYSDASLDALERREFEPNIYYALYTAKAMVLVCSEKEYVEAQWVKNEWSRYLALNGGGGLLPVFTAGCDIHDLPPEIRRLHGFSVRELDFYAKLERAADALVFSEKRKAEREEKAAAERAAREREWRERERALLEKVKSETAGGPNLSGMAARARMELRDGNPGKCADLCDKMLNTDPTCAEAWWLSFLTEKNLAGEEELPHLDETVWPQSREVRKALEFADEQQRGVYANYIEAWIGRRIAAAAQYKDAGKYWKAKRALMIPADIVEKYGGGKRFDFFYNALLLELSGGPDGETVCFGAVEELE